MSNKKNKGFLPQSLFLYTKLQKHLMQFKEHETMFLYFCADDILICGAGIAGCFGLSRDSRYSLLKIKLFWYFPPTFKRILNFYRFCKFFREFSSFSAQILSFLTFSQHFKACFEDFPDFVNVFSSTFPLMYQAKFKKF